jgi:hypothetical protein
MAERVVKKVLSEKRKQQMRDYYAERKALNKNKILNRIQKGTQKGIQRKTIEKYTSEFTATEKNVKTKRACISN